MRGRQRAFTYLGVLILVAILGSLLAVAGRARIFEPAPAAHSHAVAPHEHR